MLYSFSGYHDSVLRLSEFWKIKFSRISLPREFFEPFNSIRKFLVNTDFYSRTTSRDIIGIWTTRKIMKNYNYPLFIFFKYTKKVLISYCGILWKMMAHSMRYLLVIQPPITFCICRNREPIMQKYLEVK